MGAAVLAACPSEPSRHESERAALGGDAVVVPAAAAPPLLSGAGGAPPAVAARGRRPVAPRAPQDASAPVEMVTIHVLVEPPQRAHVWWGAKDFGLGPLDIRRPRGSGPLDLLVRAPGYLTLHTRAFTDRDNTLSVHLVPEAEAARFPGYQAPALARPTASAASRRQRGEAASDGRRPR
jgi:hypothetical protein